MKTPFFGPYGKEIDFENNSDLLKKFSNIDCSVPERTQGRTSDHNERYSLKIYLIRLSYNKLLRFSLRIRKREAPDFLIFNDDETTTALEETTATIGDFEQAQTELEKSPEGTMLESGLFKLEQSPLPKGKYKEALRKPGEKLVGDGWDGNSLEREWADIILRAIDKKTKSLNGLHFKTADRDELLIYYNGPAAGIDIKDALPLLKQDIYEKLNLKSFKRHFHCISVIHNNQLLYDVANIGLVLEEVVGKEVRE